MTNENAGSGLNERTLVFNNPVCRKLTVEWARTFVSGMDKCAEISGDPERKLVHFKSPLIFEVIILFLLFILKNVLFENE